MYAQMRCTSVFGGSHAEVRMVIEELLVQHSCPCISTNYTSQSHAWHVNPFAESNDDRA